jgi:WD40 repeat protein
MEPGVVHLLEHMYLDGSKDLQGDFGPKVHEGPIRRRTTGRHSFVSRDGTHKRPEANLVAHLNLHTDAITGLAVSPDHMFFVSASDDKTVKVWDTARLERNVTSKPRHSYSQHHAKVKCVCMLEGTHCFASAAEDGSINVVRVNVSQTGTLPKYGKLQAVREYRLEHVGEYVTCMMHFNSGVFHVLLQPYFFPETDENLFVYSVDVRTCLWRIVRLWFLRIDKTLRPISSTPQLTVSSPCWICERCASWKQWRIRDITEPSLACASTESARGWLWGQRQAS